MRGQKARSGCHEGKAVQLGLGVFSVLRCEHMGERRAVCRYAPKEGGDLWPHSGTQTSPGLVRRALTALHHHTSAATAWTPHSGDVGMETFLLVFAPLVACTCLPAHAGCSHSVRLGWSCCVAAHCNFGPFAACCACRAHIHDASTTHQMLSFRRSGC